MYTGPERRKIPLTDEQIEAVAERAAEKAMAKLTGHIGWACTTAGAPGTWKTYGLIS